MSDISPNHTGEYLQYFMPLVTALFSWLIAWLTARRIASRNTKKEAFIELLQILDDLEDVAEQLYLVAGDDPNAIPFFRAVLKKDRHLARRMKELFQVHKARSRIVGPDPVPPSIVRARINLRKMVAADELARPGRQACLGDAQELEDLARLVEALRSEIRSEAEDMNAGDLQP